MGSPADGADGDEADGERYVSGRPPRPSGSTGGSTEVRHPRFRTPRAQTPFRLERLLLVDAAGNDPVTIEALIVTDQGIGIVRRPGEEVRLLPWSAVAAHAVEPWAGGPLPAWWLEPTAVRGISSVGQAEPTSPASTSERSWPSAAGAVITVRTPFGTYRFVVAGGHAPTLSRRFTDFAVRHHGLDGVPSLTTAAIRPAPDDRRATLRANDDDSRWSRARPYLVVMLVVIIAASVSLILLQSTGVIHLAFLNGPSGTVGAARSPLDAVLRR
ncbi:MAG: hypothetical protein ACYCVN_14135 [Acidimicrobiales bacterium]